MVKLYGAVTKIHIGGGMGSWENGKMGPPHKTRARVPSGVVMDMRIVRRWTPEPSKTKPSHS